MIQWGTNTYVMILTIFIARMPHGIEAIKRHIREVDNVPLLVSLFTDSTPLTIRQMLEIFRQYGETVLAIGSGYRCYHTDIFHSSNIASSIATLPGVVPSISAKEQELFERFPAADARVLTKVDVEFAFRLVGLGTFNLIQCEESNGKSNFHLLFCVLSFFYLYLIVNQPACIIRYKQRGRLE